MRERAEGVEAGFPPVEGVWWRIATFFWSDEDGTKLGGMIVSVEAEVGVRIGCLGGEGGFVVAFERGFWRRFAKAVAVVVVDVLGTEIRRDGGNLQATFDFVGERNFGRGMVDCALPGVVGLSRTRTAEALPILSTSFAAQVPCLCTKEPTDGC